jgi:protein ImuA
MMMPIFQGSRRQIVDQLQDRLSRLEGRQSCDETIVGSGCDALDRLLPGGGFRRGKLVEWLHDCRGSGAGTLSLLCAQQIAGSYGALVVVDNRPDSNRKNSRDLNFYPPAAAAWGIDLSKLLVIRPRDQADALWAWNQALRCEGVAAVWGWVDRLDEKSFRRWQLAGEIGGAVGFLLRPAETRGQPSWSETQLLVEPRPTVAGKCIREECMCEECMHERSTRGRCLRVQVVRCRGGSPGRVAEFELDELNRQVKSPQQTQSDETHPLHLVSQLAHPAIARRSTSA